jgi:hypothetical protein
VIPDGRFYCFDVSFLITVCKDLRNTSGTVLNCTTDEATGSKACTIYCEDGKVLPPGLIDEESFTCGPSTNYEWGYLENAPSCFG